MPTRTVTPIRTRRGPLRSPLAVATQSPPSAPTEAAAGRAASRGGVPEPRAVTLDEFADYLRTVTNRDGRPYGTLEALFVSPLAELTSQNGGGDSSCPP